MDTLTAARAQMALSLGFHMIFAALGIGMPLLMVIAEGLWLRTGQPHYLALARKWGKATAILFAIGAISGTALSFELGLLWPRFMEFAGPIIGPAFALEGYAFFIEAIFIGLYLYGWDRLSPRAHWWTGVPVALSGVMSGVLVLAVNAWMQDPVLASGEIHGERGPLDPFLSPAWIPMAVHSTLSCYIAVGYAVAGVYALGMLRGRRDAYHRSALRLALAVGTVNAVLQPISGDFLGRHVARAQPIKLAAMEALFKTQARAPLVLGGIPDEEAGDVRAGITIPGALSLLVAHDVDAVIQGLDDFPADERPNVLWVHLSFQIMVGAGMALLGLGLWFWWSRWRSPDQEGTWLLRALVIGAPLGFVALEAGWLVTELGRQPWTIYGVMRTSAAVTPAPDVPITFFGFALLYGVLGVALIGLLRQLARGSPTAPADDKEAGHAS